MRKYKKKIGWLLLIIVIVVIVVWVMFQKKTERGDDYRVGVFADDGVAIVSISKSRRMINFLKLTPEVKVWIPSGMGWYRSEVVKKILSQENKKDLAGDILFYNFGFNADKIVFLKKMDSWRTKFWWKIKLGNLINKSEVLDKDGDIQIDWLNEVVLRDFSEPKILKEDLKVSVINRSKENGLAGFITDNLERLGFSVVWVSTGENEEVGGCTVLYGSEVEGTYSWDLLKKLFSNKCKVVNDISLNAGEVELYFDDKFASVIKYSSYKK